MGSCAELARRIVRGESLEGGGVEGGGSKGGLKNMISGWVKKEEGKGKGKLKQDGKTLVVVGTYSIGKERVVKGKYIQGARLFIKLIKYYIYYL